MDLKGVRYLIFLALFIGVLAGRISKTTYPTTPEIVHKWEQELRWGFSDAAGPEIRNHKFGICFSVPSPGRHCVYMDGSNNGDKDSLQDPEAYQEKLLKEREDEKNYNYLRE